MPAGNNTLQNTKVKAFLWLYSD